MKAQGILGELDAEQIGFTLAHEHLITTPPLWRIKEDPDYVLNDIAKSETELRSFASAGGKTLVEGTAIDYGRNIEALIKIAKKVQNVNIIATTGFNRGDYYDEWVHEWSVGKLAKLLISDIISGINDTSSKAGIIKIGTSYNHILPVERKTIDAACEAHIATGAPIYSHTTRGTMAPDQLGILEEKHVKPDRIAFIHMDQNLDMWIYEKLLQKGVYIMFDGPSKVKYCSDETRIDFLDRLVKKGYEDQLLISGDMGRRSYLPAYGGGPGFTYILQQFIPRLMEQGWDKSLIDKIFIKNPANYLAFIG